MTMMMCLSVWRFLRGDDAPASPARRHAAPAAQRSGRAGRAARQRLLRPSGAPPSPLGQRLAVAGLVRRGETGRRGAERWSIRPVTRGRPEQAPGRADVVSRQWVPTPTSTQVHREHRVGARRQGAHRAAVRDDQRPAGDDLARRPLHAAEPRVGAVAGLDARGAAGTADPRVHAPRRRRADAGADARRRRPRRPQLENFTTRYRHRDGSWRWLLWSARRDGDTLVRGGQGRDRPHVAGAPGAARPADPACPTGCC